MTALSFWFAISLGFVLGFLVAACFAVEGHCERCARRDRATARKGEMVIISGGRR